MKHCWLTIFIKLILWLNKLEISAPQLLFIYLCYLQLWKTKWTPSNGIVFSWVLYLMQSTQRSAVDFLLHSVKLLLSAFLLIQHLYEDENYTLFFVCYSTSFILIREHLNNTGLSCFPQKLFGCPLCKSQII